MIPQLSMKHPVLALLLVWALLAFVVFTTRSTVFLGSPGSKNQQQDTTSIWEQNPELCRNPQHQSLRNESDYNAALAAQSPVRMAKVSVLYGDVDATYERALRTHELHNRIHGLRGLVLREQVVDGVWNKPAYILSILAAELQKPATARLEWLLWVDGDTVVLNPCVPPARFLPPDHMRGTVESPINVVVSRDWNGLNNGIFLLRVSSWALELFAGVVGYRPLRPDETLTFNDQSAMERLLLEPRFAPAVAYVPQRWFNAYHAFQNETLAPERVRRGDFLVHFAGRPRRREEMEYWLAVAERHAPDWELEFYRTAYPDEIVAFWNAWYSDRNAALDM
ncbi:putative galactosyl transferase gma12 mnn10 family protein [Diplodia seriata]|uniref:Putative galactosyl transferase gma12 mnn10 family protein n=1 Tax=Diplodia seriata TaxID=420778 RepID=A0A0G2EDV8_9PEZI|nr:putative galactosyl transferase gma12 mnn10 family protein [Diplodia seriata]